MAPPLCPVDSAAGVINALFRGNLTEFVRRSVMVVIGFGRWTNTHP